ncbi:hypothetical protein E5K90_06730 [Helicobacter pylori]|nr:hypothetical protein E5K90_06730 [Helicobacter pylori]
MSGYPGHIPGSTKEEPLKRIADALEVMGQAMYDSVKQQEKIVQIMQDSVKKQEEIAKEIADVSKSVYHWVDQGSFNSQLSPLVDINRNLRMLNEQAFKVLQSQNLLDLQAEKELDRALGSITGFEWYCQGSYNRKWNT